MKTSLGGRFIATGVTLYCGLAGILLARTSLSFAADLWWALVLTGLLLAAFAVWYRVTVGRVGGRRSNAWSLSDAASVKVRLPSDRAIARVKTIAEGAFPTVLFSREGDDLLLTKPGGWWLGNSTVRVTATATTEEATELRFSSESAKLLNNGVCRGIINRVIDGLEGPTGASLHA